MKKNDIKDLIDKFTQLLDKERLESPIQKFIEKHPFLIAGPEHQDHDVVISQLPLGADYKVDFAYLYHDSSGNYIKLIEIEKPSLRIFTDQDEFTQDYNQAFQQMLDWTEWTKKHLDYLEEILSPFLEYGFDFPSTILCTLVAGRRNELSSRKRKNRWKSKSDSLIKGYQIRTYDGLIESIPIGKFIHMSSELKCVVYKDQSFVEKQLGKIC